VAHWSEGYIDVPHAVENCAALVERLRREQFGSKQVFPRPERRAVFHHSDLITSHLRDFVTPIDAPHDGCCVIVLARGRLAHIGMYCELPDQPYLLHSDSWFGASVRIPMSRVCAPRFRIEGFYAWLD